MNRLACAALAMACAVAVTGPLAPAARAATAPVLVTLKNGMRVVLAPDSAATAVDVATWYDAGARTLPANQEGVRHLAERLLFLGDAQGTRARALTAEGGSAGSATTADAVVFWETMPAEALGLALRTEADRMAPAQATPEAFDVARRAAAAEARVRGNFAPVAAALTRLAASVFQGEPYARPLVTTEQAISALQPAPVEAWRASQLAPANAVLTLVGRFEPQATLEAVRRVFEPLPRGAVRARTSPGAPRAGERRVSAITDTPVPMLLVGWRVPGASDPDAPAIDLLASAMGGGEDSRINQVLTANGRTATAGQCGVDRRRDGSMLWAAAVTTASGDSTAAERLLLDVMGSLAREPLSGSDFDRARAQLVTSELFRAQDLHARAGSLADAVFAGGSPGPVDERLAALARLTPEDLQRVARRILVDNARTVLWLIPEGGAQ
jgi:zinc protease